MKNLQYAYLGMQCFWGSESAFALLPGVQKTRVGYSGGSTSSPTYQNIGDHTEVVELLFNKELTTYKEIIKLFYSQHNITQARKTQYKSLILYVDEEQKNIAIEEMEKAKKNMTRKLFSIHFYKNLKNFIKLKIIIKNTGFVLKLNNSELINSTMAAKINAFLGGCSKDFDLLYSIQKQYNLSDSLIKSVKDIATAVIKSKYFIDRKMMALTIKWKRTKKLKLTI
ncbi:PMSR domain-containing protein [Meloidogyne graminicola]|uniref:peptide-methionine (S)-S-oxide reductase n=1 Tax=Meloidogyne graminicola TaxID=189291 RepID=A0A8T0A088_9BILA|nr:PMSR domain-containing protein [Meloidogyne graminicola]